MELPVLQISMAPGRRAPFWLPEERTSYSPPWRAILQSSGPSKRHFCALFDLIWLQISFKLAEKLLNSPAPTPSQSRQQTHLYSKQLQNSDIFIALSCRSFTGAGDWTSGYLSSRVSASKRRGLWSRKETQDKGYGSLKFKLKTNRHFTVIRFNLIVSFSAFHLLLVTGRGPLPAASATIDRLVCKRRKRRRDSRSNRPIRANSVRTIVYICPARVKINSFIFKWSRRRKSIASTKQRRQTSGRNPARAAFHRLG